MTEMYPQVVGHEIVGEVLRVGDKVDKSIKVGDVVGVGAQCDSCQSCLYCDKGEYRSRIGGAMRHKADAWTRTRAIL